MHRCLLNFVGRDGYHVHFIEEDCRTLIDPPTRYWSFATKDALRSFVQRCHPENPDDFERSLRSWGQGSTLVLLTDEQYARLKQ